MKKEDEIKRDLSAAVDGYENLMAEGKREEARQAAEKIKDLTADLNNERVAEAARKEVAAKTITAEEKKRLTVSLSEK